LALAGGEYFAGTGLTMEAIDHNPVVYEFMIQQAFDHGSPTDVFDWLQSYIIRRYGLAREKSNSVKMVAATDAWNLLLSNNYNGYVECYEPTCKRRSIITTRPLLDLYQETRVNLAGPVVIAWRELQKVAQGLVSSYLYDLVDLARQVTVTSY
jgi:alpha-N-acetylglucosaminidase